MAKKKTTRKKAKSPRVKEVSRYQHDDKRANNPEVGLVTAETEGADSKQEWSYDPHLDPELQFDSARAGIEKLIDEALASEDPEAKQAALEELKRLQAPYLAWTGKAEHTSFEVDTVSLHVHEKVDPVTILESVKPKAEADASGRVREGENLEQADLFEGAFKPEPLREAIGFYKHERDWANRMVAGDSLLVMNSLLQKESMAGRVQMIYLDPPYGIKYGSNFQPFVNKRDVKDRSDDDLTAEPEMLKAFRDTWELGIHSYLTYLRDRLVLARELLHESGSVFVQISDENVHLVRNLMDEVFGVENFVSLITFVKTTSASSESLAGVSDYLIWYGRSQEIKYRQPYEFKKLGGKGATGYSWKQLESGERLKGIPLSEEERSLTLDNLTSQRPPGDFPIEHKGLVYRPKTGYWKTGEEGMPRLVKASRIDLVGNTLRYVRFFDDFPVFPRTNLWTDTSVAGFAANKKYVVETTEKVIERCLLMTTDPGDLVLDPTCGSGTTAYVAEKWGRRWITCDTSRVAIALAKQRLMTAGFDYFPLRYPNEGVRGGFHYKTVPHIMLKSIANNPEIDELYEKLHPAITKALEKLKSETGNPKLEEWEVPFDFPEDWPDSAKKPFQAFHRSRQAMQRAMDESIAAHADQEILYDQPEIDKTKARVTGPFTLEAVPFPTVLSLEEAVEPTEATSAVARSGESARQHEWKDELVKTGIRGKGGQKVEFAELETCPGTRYLHATGTTVDGEPVAVSFGPAHTALEQKQVEHALTDARKLVPAPKFVVFAAFQFDPEAAKDIDEMIWPGVTLLKAQMNTDLLTEDLKRGRASNESFWLMGQPDVELKAADDGTYQVEVFGFDYFNTKTGELDSGGKAKIAMWMLDTDYDERALLPRQVFFPMAGKKEGWNRLAKTLNGAVDAELLEAFEGTVSLPFEPGENRRVAVKIIDDRGIESLKILPLD